MKMYRNLFSLFALILFLTSIKPALAAPPTTLDYQGFLTDRGGIPVDGAVSITFGLYDVGAGGVPLWTMSQPVNVSHGVFSVQLGDPLTPFPLTMFENPLWLGITVAGDEEMFPRRPINAVGYAYLSKQAENDADTLGSLSCAPGTIAKFDGTGWVCASDESGSSDWNSLLNIPSGFEDGIDNDTITTSFADLTDTATDAQIPNNITIDQAANANTVDNLHASGSPVPGRLLALDGGGKFPNSTLIMGPGSSLDADTVDGWHASGFSLVSHWHSYLNAADGSPTNALSVDSIGRVGIGTTSPAVALHVYGSNPRIRIEESGSSNPEINLSSAGTNDWAIYKQGVSGDLRFYQAGDKIIFKNGGNVGIGVADPQFKLHVAGIANFDLGVGTIAISTPGGVNPGMITFAPNGNRRDVTITNDGLAVTASASSGAPGLSSGLFIAENGNVGFGTTAPGYRVDVNGRVRTKTLEITGGSDLSEQFDISDRVDLLKPLPGMVVSIDPNRAGALVVSDHAYNRRVAGIISGAGDVRPGMIMGHKGTVADGAHPVALTGRVYCFAETSGGVIEPGDLLTTSDIPGYAMKVMDYGKAQGAIIGKAMTRLDAGRGQVLVLVSLQ